MAPIRKSRRLERKATDAQEEAKAAAATQVAAKTAAPAPAARNTASARKKTTARGPKAAPVDTVMTRPAGRPKTKKSTSSRKTPTTTTATTTTSAPKKSRAMTRVTTTTKAKAIATAAKKKEAKPKAKGLKKVKDEPTTAEEEEVKPRVKRAKKSKNVTASPAAAGAEVMEPKVKTKRARKVKTEDGDTMTSTETARRKKRKADPENDGTDGSGEGSGTASSTQAGPVTKKSRTTKGKKTGAASAVEPPKPIIVNKSDPYSALPTELWHEVMSYLSLIQIARASSVSKGWLEGIQSLQVWRDICTNAALGSPKKKYPTHMSLVCAQSYWICERCLTMNNGKGSDIPLPVEVAELGNEKLMLCRACRRQYYKIHPEGTKIRKNVMNHYGEYIYERDVRMTKTDACSMFYLKDEDLLSLRCVTKRNPHYRNAAPMKLYLEKDVQRRSLEIHGGWIGIRAISDEVAKIRRMDAKTRAQELPTRVIQSTDKKTKKKDTSSTKGKILMTQAAALATHDENTRAWVKLLQEPQRKALVVEAIAEVERRIAAGEPPLAIDHKWINTLSFAPNANSLTWEEIKKIVQDFEAGVYDALQGSWASSIEAATGGGAGATQSTGAGSSSSMAVLPPAMGTVMTVA